MNIEEYDRKFDKGIEYRDKGLKLRDKDDHDAAAKEFHKAIQIFESIIDIHVKSDFFKKHLILGSLFSWIGNIPKALEHFSDATLLDPNSEIASLSLYLALIESNRSGDAIDEISRFLNKNPARLFKDTLFELKEEIDRGRLPLFRQTILDLFGKHITD